MKILKHICLLSIIGALMACTDEPGTNKSSQNKAALIAKGEQIFNQKHLGKDKVTGCVLCHSVEPHKVIIGPSLSGLSIRAPHLVANENAMQYVRHSIINPDAYIVDGYLPGTMPSTFKSALSTKELDALVAYLLQL